MKKKIFLISTVGCLLLFAGCAEQGSFNSDIKNVTSVEDGDKIREVDLEFEEFEKKIGLEKIRSYDTVSDLHLDVLNEDFIKKRQEMLNPELINEEVVLKCADRAIQISKLTGREEKVYSVGFISEIDKIHYKMDKNLVLKLINRLYSFGDFEKLALRKKDSKDVLVNQYIVKTLEAAVEYNEGFSDKERIAIFMVLMNFEMLNEYTSSIGMFSGSIGEADSILNDIKSSYYEDFEKFEKITNPHSS